MVTKYRYTMRVTADKLMTLIEGATGRSPDAMGKSGLHTWSFDFHDTDIDEGDRLAVKAAIPEFLRLMFSFDREVVDEEE